MSSYTMHKGVQRKLRQQGFTLTPNAEFRQDPVTGRVGVFSTKKLEVGHPLLITNSVLADVFVRQRNLPADYMAGHVLPTPAQLDEHEEEGQEEVQHDPIRPRSEEQPAFQPAPFEAEALTTPTEVAPQFEHKDSPMNGSTLSFPLF